jgi:thiol-disulfide isomerase/thioredoxin
MLRTCTKPTALLFTTGLAIAFLSGPTARADDIESYLVGELTHLEPLETPVSLADHQITYPDGTNHALKEKGGKALLVNLWARGCVPCKDEMEDLSNLQKELGDDQFEVVALPMEQRSIKSVSKILTKWKAENLQPYSHDLHALARILYDQHLFTEPEISFAFPTTYVVNKSGRILAVREGFLHWDTPETRALISAIKQDRLD